MLLLYELSMKISWYISATLWLYTLHYIWLYTFHLLHGVALHYQLPVPVHFLDRQQNETFTIPLKVHRENKTKNNKTLINTLPLSTLSPFPKQCSLLQSLLSGALMSQSASLCGQMDSRERQHMIMCK